MSAVDEQLVSQKGRPGRKSSTAPMEQSIYVPSRMDQLLSHVQLLPDPDDVWRKGLLSYRDLYSLTRDAHASSCLDQRKSQPMSRAIRTGDRWQQEHIRIIQHRLHFMARLKAGHLYPIFQLILFN